jgi:hypothetical protein
MGVLYDYFRSADAAAVAKLMEATAGHSPLYPDGAAAADGIDAKGIEPVVTLGQLIAMILDVEWESDLANGDLVWPAGESDEDDDGPWVQAVNQRARDALAGVDDARLPELAERWAGIEELRADSPEAVEGLRAVATDLVGLARRARAAGDQLYCWMSL